MKVYMPELVDHKDRLMQLQRFAFKVEEKDYQKPLSPEELAARREDLADDCIKLNKLEDELKEIKDEYKAKMDPLKTANKIRLQEIKTKQTNTSGKIYHIVNEEDSMMEFYDDNGCMVESRRLRPEEKLGPVFQMGKTGG